MRGIELRVGAARILCRSERLVEFPYAYESTGECRKPYRSPVVGGADSQPPPQRLDARFVLPAQQLGGAQCGPSLRVVWVLFDRAFEERQSPLRIAKVCQSAARVAQHL